MRSPALFATALLAALPFAFSANAAEEPMPARQPGISDPAPIRDIAATSLDATEEHVAPVAIQTARRPEELPLSEIKILPSF